MRWVAAALLAIVIMPTVAAQGDPLCIIFFEPSADFRLIDVKADLILTPEERENISAAVDADHDNMITAAEVSTYENSTTLELGTDASAYGERMLYIDGNPPTGMTAYTKLRDWTGPIEEARKGVVSEFREYRMTPGSDVGHILTGGLYAVPDSFSRHRPVIETIVINAPEGWVVWEVSHAPQPPTPPTPSDGNTSATSYPSYYPTSPTVTSERYLRQSVQISSFDIRRSYSVSFAKEGEDPMQVRGGPGFEPILALAAIAAVAFVVRRRR